MNLKRLLVEKEDWGKRKGQYTGKAEFESNLGSITLNLTPEKMERVLAVFSEALIETSKEAAEELTCTVINQAKALEVSVDS